VPALLPLSAQRAGRPLDSRRDGGATIVRGKAMHPFDLKTALLAKHAQHLVLIHFPIALFLTGVAFDLCACWLARRSLGDAAYFNFMVATLATLPVVASGLLAW
jgi:hypothetical protein